MVVVLPAPDKQTLVELTKTKFQNVLTAKEPPDILVRIKAVPALAAEVPLVPDKPHLVVKVKFKLVAAKTAQEPLTIAAEPVQTAVAQAH